MCHFVFRSQHLCSLTDPDQWISVENFRVLDFLISGSPDGKNVCSMVDLALLPSNASEAGYIKVALNVFKFCYDRIIFPIRTPKCFQLLSWNIGYTPPFPSVHLGPMLSKVGPETGSAHASGVIGVLVELLLMLFSVP